MAFQNDGIIRRTRVARVRAEYPNQLDYSGSVLFDYFISQPPTVFVTVREPFQRVCTEVMSLQQSEHGMT